MKKYDKYLLASSLQKSIRRNNLPLALKACKALFYIDYKYLQRRLMVIALEDIGVGDITLIFETPNFFDKNTNLDKIKTLVTKLTLAPKCQLTNILAMIAHNEHKLISIYQKSTWEHIIDDYQNQDISIQKRAVAGLFLAGQIKTKPSPPERFNALNTFDNEIKEVIPQYYKYAYCNLCFTFPLIYQKYSSSPSYTIHEIPTLNTTPENIDINLSALDAHTKLGKTAISQWYQNNKELQQLKFEQIQEILFFAEGILTSPQKKWELSNKLKKEVIQILNKKLKNNILNSIEIIKSHLISLEDIRINLLLSDIKSNILLLD